MQRFIFSELEFRILMVRKESVMKKFYTFRTGIG
jgi:hypothetical protein